MDYLKKRMAIYDRSIILVTVNISIFYLEIKKNGFYLSEKNTKQSNLQVGD